MNAAILAQEMRCWNIHQSSPTHWAGRGDLLCMSGGVPTDTVKDFALSEIGRIGSPPRGCQPGSESGAACSTLGLAECDRLLRTLREAKRKKDLA